MDSRQRALELPLGTRFRLASTISSVQRAFLELHGFLVFDAVASPEEVALLLSEADRIQRQLLNEERESVFGVPVWVGADPDGAPFLQRLAFASVFSEAIHSFIRDPRFEPLRALVGEKARIGDREKDGVVLNRYINAPGSLRPGVGWHTDGLRDVFYNWRMPLPQLNVGLHLTQVGPGDGGLRVLPGTHHQGVWSTLFRKAYFVSQKPDSGEFAIETQPGDLTVHDGRLWHRVAPSPKQGWESMRVSMYVPYVTDRHAPKAEDTPPLLYHRVFDAVMRHRRKRNARR